MYKESREKLVEKNISWHEEYTDKTQFLKDQFNDVVGPGSYYRFEGRAPDGDEYYCIVGPAKVHHPRAKFFAGVRKLPATYSAGGKYFDSLDSAAKYARETWGVPTPNTLKPYTSRQLFGISQKVHDWKAKREEEESKGKKKDKDDDKGKDIESFNIDVLVKEAMPANKDLRTGYIFHTYEAIVSKKVKNFEDLIKNNPSFIGALNEIKDEKRRRYAIYSRKYGFSPEKMREIFRIYIGYSRHHGLYAIYNGPYLMAPKDVKRFYAGLHKAGLLPEDIYNNGKIRYGMDIPESIIRKVLISKNQGLKKLAGLYHTDLSGKFQSFSKPYHVPSYFKGWQEVSGHVEKQGLAEFNEYDEVENAMQAKNIRENGTPLAQRFGLSDYSYAFNYRTTYLIGDIKGSQKFFRKKPLDSVDPDGNTFHYGPYLPPNHRDDSLCQTYSFDRFEDAKSNNMIISQSGTKIFLNRDGLKKVILNMIASHPQYNERLMEHMRNNTAKLNGVHKEYVTKDLNSFLYFFLGVGEMDEEGKLAIKQHFLSKADGGSERSTNNGVLNLDDYKQYKCEKGKNIGKMIDKTFCGLNQFRKLQKEIMNFYAKAIGEDSNTVKFSRFDCIDEETASRLAKAGFTDLVSVREADDSALVKAGISNEEIQKIKVGLHTLGDDINSVDSETKSKLRQHSQNLTQIHRLYCLTKNRSPVVNVYATEEDKAISHLTYLDSVTEDTAKLLFDGGISTINYLKKESKASLVNMGLSENVAKEVITEVLGLTKEQLSAIPSKSKMWNQGAFLRPKGAITNAPLAITSRAKNEYRLLSEIASFMMTQRIDTLSDNGTELVVAYLNSGGSDDPEWHKSKRNKTRTLNVPIKRRINHMVEDDSGDRYRKIYFFSANVKPLMAKVLSSKIQSELIDFVNSKGIEEASVHTAEVAVSYLESKGHRDYFTTDNIMGLLDDSIYKAKNGKKDEFGSDIGNISRRLNRQAVLMEEIYNEERKSRKHADYISDKSVSEDDEDDGASNLNLVWNDLCPNCGVKGDVSEHGDELIGICPNCSTQFKPRFESFDVHTSFHEVFEQTRDVAETMSYQNIEKDEKLIDPVTRAMLIPVNENGVADIQRVPRIFYSPPKGNMRSGKLKKIFSSQTEEEKKKYRTLQSDLEMAQFLLGPFSSANMDLLSRDEYEYQLNISKEIDEEMNLQVATDEPIENPISEEEEEEKEEKEEEEDVTDDVVDESTDDPTVTIENEVDLVENPEDLVEQPLNKPQQQPVQDPFANLNIQEEEGFGNMIEEEDDDKKTEASREVINNLLKLSQELDDEGKGTESKELLRLAKKFSGNIRKGK